MASPAKKVAQALEPERDLVQFLDHEGNLVGTPDYPLTDEDLQKLYAHLVRARLTDEKGINLQRQGRIVFARSELRDERDAALRTGVGPLWPGVSYRDPRQLRG